MKFAVILENAPDCELDRKEFEFENLPDDDQTVHNAVEEAILLWTLRVGDAIRIVEIAA